ncbi:MAG: O-antigen ligase family protein [Acidobacteriia bacterium]|nr:O-antigen ligase family protein [Terriglobia bacterium]
MEAVPRLASTGQITLRNSVPALAHWTVVTAFRPLHALMAAPAMLFLATLTVMLFRPPDTRFCWVDRIAFLLLVFVALLRVLVLRRRPTIAAPAMWPMAGLLLLALGSLLAQSYDAQSWSVFAAKWLVPFALYHLAGSVFDDAASLRQLETFALVVLGHLSAIAILFLCGAKGLIFPRYILDESLGIHADRARGPFLQAVANGVTLNLLGLIAMDSFRRGRLKGLLAVLLLIAVPLAVLATQTRAVWLSFAGCVPALIFFSSSKRVRRACLGLILAGGVGLLTVLSFEDTNTSFFDRLEERSPVEFRVVMYQTGLEMFLEKPLTGWGSSELQPELAKRVHDFHQSAFFFHNTYLEIAVQHGLVGLLLYLRIVVELFRVGGRRHPHTAARDGTFLDEQFRSFWPVLVAVYLFNGSFVVMNYQFVNGLVFTIAGILAAQNRQADAHSHALLN